jgi:hypothetical protein
MTLLCATKTQDGNIIVVSDTREIDNSLYAWQSERKLSSLKWDSLLWGYAGSKYFGKRVYGAVHKRNLHTWDDVLCAVKSEVWCVNEPPSTIPNSMITVLLAGFIDGEPHMAQIDPTGDVINSDQDTLFVGTPVHEAKVAWESMRMAIPKQNPVDRFATIYRALTASGCHSVALPLDVGKLTPASRCPKWTRVET